jgi:multidrug efflux pump subunit AcrB
MATISIFIVALSLILKELLPQDFMPKIEVPKISILIKCSNCSNQKIEEEVVAPLRTQLVLLDGLKDISAESIAGKGIIELEFFYGQSVEKKVYAINEIIDRTQENFPIAVQRPVVYPFQLNDIPVVLLSIQKKQGQEYQHLEEIKRALESLNSVSFTDNIGQTMKQVIVQPKYERLDHLGIPSRQLYQSIQKSISTHPLEFQIQEGSQIMDLTVIDTIAQIKDIQIDWNNRSIPLHLLADLKEEIYYDRGQFLLNGQPAVLFSIYKQPHQSYQKFHSELQDRISDLKFNLPEYNIQVLRNHSNIVQESISALQSSFLAGIALIIALVYLFYKRIHITLLAGGSLLLTISGLVVIFFILNLSINLLSISAIMITIGIVIDNTIIIVDGLQRIQKKDNFKAIGNSVNQILPALITGNLTTLIIFIPLVFLPNLPGQLLKYFGLILGIGLGTGLLVSLIFIPIFFNRSFKTTPQSSLALRWTNGYVHLHKIWVKKNSFSIVSTLIIISSGLFCWTKLPKDLIPSLEFEEMSFFIPYSTFSNKNLTSSHLKILEDWASNSPCRSWFLKSTDGGAFDHRIQSQEDGWILGFSNCISNATEEFSSTFQNLFKAEKIHNNPIHSFFNYKDQFFELRIRSKELAKLPSNIPVSSTTYTIDTQYSTIPLQLLKSKIEQGEVTTIMESLSNRIIIPTKSIGGEESSIRVEKRNQYLSEILVKNKFHHFIPLSFLVRPIVKSRPNRIYSDAYGPVENLVISNQAYPALLQWLIQDSISNYQIRGLPNLKNEQQIDFLKIGGTTLFALIFMLFLHFQSWKLSLLIIMEIPFSIMGSLTLLHLFNVSVNTMSLAGMIISLGIVVNDSILKLDTVQQLLKRKNYSLKKVVLIAGKQRFLPIILTSLSTVLAVIPIFWSHTIGNQLQIPFALSLLGGMTVSTFTSLFLLPKWILWLKF